MHCLLIWGRAGNDRAEVFCQQPAKVSWEAGKNVRLDGTIHGRIVGSSWNCKWVKAGCFIDETEAAARRSLLEDSWVRLFFYYTAGLQFEQHSRRKTRRTIQ